MGFETVILSVVRDVVRHANAGFSYGTLFVGNIDETEANRILNNLQNYTPSKVIMSDCNGEFAYDFT